jgi:hypothetical protein
MLEFHAILSVSLKRILGCRAYSFGQVGYLTTNKG